MGCCCIVLVPWFVFPSDLTRLKFRSDPRSYQIVLVKIFSSSTSGLLCRHVNFNINSSKLSIKSKVCIYTILAKVFRRNQPAKQSWSRGVTWSKSSCQAHWKLHAHNQGNEKFHISWNEHISTSFIAHASKELAKMKFSRLFIIFL